MKLFRKMKDGGPDSNVMGYFLFESKRFGSIALLRFSDGSRDAYHSHAFDALSWVLKGSLEEFFLDGFLQKHKPSFWPILTLREDFHKVRSNGTTWVFTLRGPWKDQWDEYLPADEQFVKLTHGRKVVENKT